MAPTRATPGSIPFSKNKKWLGLSIISAGTAKRKGVAAEIERTVEPMFAVQRGRKAKHTAV